MKMEKEENILGTEKIGKLVRKFSIPCIISLVVNALYNIVDQIFIGQGVGYLGNGATNVVFPLTIIGLAFALMFADGASAYLSLKLGEKKKQEAAKGVGNGIAMAIIISILFCAITLIFLPQLLNLFGCTVALRDYAMGYGWIIAIGLPFSMIGTTLNSIIRADGSPKFAMASMVAGAVLNIILDPIFIYVFHMGVEGAAIATIFSQFVTFILNALYMRKIKTIQFSKETLKLKFSIVRRVAALGISSFITQMTFVILISVENNLLGKYGVNSKYGSEIPITVVGIVMKVNQILSSIILGIAVGAQPIFGYNYGARKFDRVTKTLKIVLSLSVVISTIAFILFQTIPDKLISIFGSGDASYMEFACLTFRIYLMLCICNGVQIPAGIFFQAIGKSSKSAILSLSRQIVLLIPAMFILSSIFGLMGVLYAAPVADGIAFILAATLLILEVKKLKKPNYMQEAVSTNMKVGQNDDGISVNPEDTNTNVDDESNIDTKKPNEHMIITIAREYGSGGRYIGRLVAEKLGLKFYDKEFIQKLAQKTGLSEEYIENSEQKREVLDNINNGYYAGMNNADELYVHEANLIKEIAKKESCVIIGRCADFVLKDRKDVTKIFIYNDMDSKIKRATKYYGLDKQKAEKEITKINKLRANHYKYYTDLEWDDHSHYDLCINSDALGVEKSAELICDFVKQKELISH